MRLLTQPGISIPNTAWNERIVVPGNDVNGTRAGRTLQDRKRPRCIGSRNAVVVEDVARDEDEIHAAFGGFISQSFQRRKPRFTDSAASVFVKSSDSQAKVKVGGVKESNHGVPSNAFINASLNASCRQGRSSLAGTGGIRHLAKTT